MGAADDRMATNPRANPAAETRRETRDLLASISGSFFFLGSGPSQQPLPAVILKSFQFSMWTNLHGCSLLRILLGCGHVYMDVALSPVSTLDSKLAPFA